MRILMINKFLYPNGGSETYMFRLGEELRRQGHEVQYFGMEHEGRCVGNRLESYTSSVDFHGGSRLSKLTYPLKTIYSSEARKKLRPVLEDFQPDAVHLHNFNYQLTPSVILETDSWRKKSGHKCRIIYTAHDYQLVCPSHMCRDHSGQSCERCLKGSYMNCVKGRCIHGSAARSAVGACESAYWHRRGTYGLIDAIVCCSRFMQSKLDTDPLLAQRTLTMHNFLTMELPAAGQGFRKGNYVLYFGRYSEEKGVKTLLEVARSLPEIPFVLAGSGPLEEQTRGIPNVKQVGFQSGEALQRLIGEASFTVYPSEWYENCPLSVIESMVLGTPVIGARIGGIP